MQGLGWDIRYALRSLARTPTWTAIAVATLALAIGATTAIFSLVHGVLLAPPPYDEPERLAFVQLRHSETGETNARVPRPIAEAWSAANPDKFHTAAFRTQPMDLVEGGLPERVPVRFVSRKYFALLREQPLLGRALGPVDFAPEAPATVVVSHRVWSERFSSDPNFVGRTIELDGKPYAVAGILPADFHDIPALPRLISADADFWLPSTPALDPLARGRISAYQVFARLTQPTQLSVAAAEWEVALRQFEETDPAKFGPLRVEAFTLEDAIARTPRQPLLLLFGAVGVILLIACANVANLLLARAARREGDIAVRRSLGASRFRLAQHVLTESVLLGVGGGLVGIVLAWLTLDFLVAVLPVKLPATATIGLSLPVLGFAVGISLVSALLFGALPAVRAGRADISSSLKGSSAHRLTRRSRINQVLATVEIAAALVLLVTGGLLLKSFLGLTAVEPGFDPDSVLTARVSLPRARYASREARIGFYQRVAARLRALPGVEAAGMVSALPLSGSAMGVPFAIEGRPVPEGQQRPSVEWNQADAAYFDAMRIQVLQGRGIDAQDIAQGARVVVINQAMADRFFPGEDPVGKRLQLGAARYDNPWDEIVGVVANVRHKGLELGDEPQMYTAYSEMPPPWATFVMRSSIAASELAALTREQILAEDATLPVLSVRTMEEVLHDSLERQRSYAYLLGCMAALALFLAAVGVYGVLQFLVAQRIPEMGIRRALGAQASDVLALVLRGGLLLAGLGVAIGLVASAGVARLLESELHRVSPVDAPTYAGAALILVVAAMLACYFPARRAAKADPLDSLRTQ